MPILPPLPSLRAIQERLPQIFAEGTPNRVYCIREAAAKTVFVMLYVGAVEGTNRWLAPKQVYRMSDTQVVKKSNADRLAYTTGCMKPGYQPAGIRWYHDNSREQIRDETLREGLVQVGAVAVRLDIPTTSSKGRYALKADFAALFNPGVSQDVLEARIKAWQKANLSAGALARVQIIRRGGVLAAGEVLVTFPNRETRRMAAGPSSVISKSVLEEFAPRFLEQPAVIFLSESRQKVIEKHDELAKQIGLDIKVDRHLPDIVLVDLGPGDPLVVFVEVVATDGAVTDARKKALLKLTTDAGFDPARVAFVTAYLDRGAQVYRRTVSSLAWHSFAWFASEPDNIVVLREGGKARRARLYDLLG